MPDARGLLQFPHPVMGELFVRVALCTLLMLCLPSDSLAEDGSSADTDLPSAELLEFLGDLEPLDDETWELLEHHALRDAAQRKQGDRQ